MRMLRLVSVALAALIAATGPPAFAVSLQPGWPQTAGDYAGTEDGQIWSSPTLADMDNDGKLELVIGSMDGSVYAWDTDGTPMPGWPQATVGGVGLGQVNSSPALADLDGDDELEVVIGSWDGGVYAWDTDGTPMPGWPQFTLGMVAGSPTVVDLDGDGDLEVLCGSRDSFVYAWHADGTTVAGWPRGTGLWVNETPAVADIDGDGTLEVVVSSWDHLIYVWHADGNNQPGWPQSTGVLTARSPALGDLDGDGELEIVAGSASESDAIPADPPANKVYAWNADGSPVTGWPQTTTATQWNCPVLGDINGDGDLEVVAEVGYGDHGGAYAWRGDGSAVPGWPKNTAYGGWVYASPALGSMNGDGTLDVMIGSYVGQVYAWHSGGSNVSGWPQSLSDSVGSSPAMADMDGDGKLEVAVGCYDGKVYVWKCDTTTSDPLPWPMFRHDLLRTGRYTPPAPAADFSGTPTQGVAPLTVHFTDLSANSPSVWAWDFGDTGVSTDKNPSHTFVDAGHHTVSLTASNSGGSSHVEKQNYITVTFPDVPFVPEHWALYQILACVDAGIVQGYPGGLYKPAVEVTRDQMAVYISRAVAGSDEGVQVPTGVVTPTFPDVLADHWAYRYVEYCAGAGIVQGFWNGTYHPLEVVSRGQMAVYVARAVATPIGDTGVPEVPAGTPPTFPDVTADNDYAWCYKHVEYISGLGIVQGYWDGKYHPERAVSRDQMAVYVARAFGLVD